MSKFPKKKASIFGMYPILEYSGDLWIGGGLIFMNPFVILRFVIYFFSYS